MDPGILQKWAEQGGLGIVPSGVKGQSSGREPGGRSPPENETKYEII